MAIACDRVRDLASGFVLESLDPAEMIAVREHLGSCSKFHPELRELGGVVPYLGGSLDPVEPSSQLRATVIAAARADLLARQEVTAPAPVSARADVTAAARQNVVALAPVRAARARRAAFWAGRIAAAVAVIALVGYAVVLKADLDKAHSDATNADKVYAALMQSGSRSAFLTPSQGHRGAGEAVLMIASGHVLVNLHGLDATSGDQVYMVWISKDGGPMSRSGWFTVSDLGTGFLEIDGVSAADTVWVAVTHAANTDVAQWPGSPVVSGTIYIYPAPAATPTR
jgi:hypothetical protein